MHKIMYSHMNNPIAGQTKNVQNYISAAYPDGHTEILFTPLAPFETPEALDRICVVETKLPAIDMVRKAAQNKIGRFNKQDIRELCPSLSISSIEGSLRKLVKSGELKREGAGKATCYIRLK